MTSVDRFSERRLRLLRQEISHVIKRQEQLMLAMVLGNAFYEYHLSEAYRVSATSNTTYQEAERAADFFSQITDSDVPVYAFLPKEEDYDKTIEHYQNYRKAKDMVVKFGYAEGDVDAFCQRLQNEPWTMGLTAFNAFCCVGWSHSIVAVYRYMNGQDTYEEMRRGMFTYIPHEKRVMDDKMVYIFAKTLFRLVREFKEIVDKRKRRKNDVLLCTMRQK